MRDEEDALALRNAARVLRARGPEKQPFSLRVIVRTLDRAATRIEEKARAREQGQDVSDAASRRSAPGGVEG